MYINMDIPSFERPEIFIWYDANAIKGESSYSLINLSIPLVVEIYSVRVPFSTIIIK